MGTLVYLKAYDKCALERTASLSFLSALEGWWTGRPNSALLFLHGADMWLGGRLHTPEEKMVVEELRFLKEIKELEVKKELGLVKD